MANEKSAHIANAAQPATKIGIGTVVHYWSMRSGGQAVRCPAVIVTLHKPVAGEKDDAGHADLDFEFKNGTSTVQRQAFVVRRGRGAEDAPCWTPLG